MSTHSISVTHPYTPPPDNDWRAVCACKERWQGTSYEAVEDEWRKHVHAETGRAPAPCGRKVGRWEP